MQASLFGTDGIRRRVGDEPLTEPSLIILGAAIGRWMTEGISTPRILIAHDGRASAEFIKASLLKGLCGYSIHISDTGMQPTPFVCNLVQRQQKFDFGIVISASHNTYEDNGIKLVTKRDGKLSAEDEAIITTYFYEAHTPTTHHQATVTFTDLSTDYITDVQTQVGTLALTGKRVVIDCANGAFSYLAPQIMSIFGCSTLFINHTPDGVNINAECGATHVTSLQQAVHDTKADIGFAFDGDGDRIMVVARDGSVKDGDDILALLLTHPTYHAAAGVVGTIMTNQGFVARVEQQGRRLIRAQVGDKYIIRALKAENLELGGEPSGHIIMRDYMLTGDGLYTALKILQTCALTGNWDVTSFARYPQVLINVPVVHKKDLTEESLARLIRESEQQLTAGRLIARYSGTENLLRIMVEDTNATHAQHIGSHLADQLKRELS